MKSVLAAGLLATTAVATPLSLNPNPAISNNTIHTRQAIAQGQDSNIKISLYTKPGCKGTETIKEQEMYYDRNIIAQLRSYSLSDDLGRDDMLAFMADKSWTATGSKAVDPSLNSNPAACDQFAYNAAVDDTIAGCHSVPNALGCVAIRIGAS